ncbi:AI-2E family transporter [Subtercola frigoramans]|uniref:PurR-regulated permease PerM n=1 Tax=Subtercola frigoramans TaxID=120298 RepID=A0ABS2L1D1_9MICO|nr:AI-2E family transporter [Subtercola frigoramans]MBM7470893.1 putative PurR-regulated permease PerM [Subtercola frigoramans]
MTDNTSDAGLEAAPKADSAAATGSNHVEPLEGLRVVDTGSIIDDPGMIGSPHRGFGWGYVVTLGVLGALATGLAIYNLRTIVFSVFLALFVTVGLDPLVRWFERRRFTRAWALVTVILLIIALLVTVVWVILPLIIQQVSQLAVSIPAEITRLRDEGWFDQTNEASNGVVGAILSWIAKEASDPQVWVTVGNGLVGLGLDIANAITSGFFIAILTIYFVATYDATKEAGFKLVAASKRASFEKYTNQILRNVGKYLSGMVILAFCNAVYSVVLLSIVGVPGAFIIGIAAFFITLIPLIGTVLTTCAMTVIAFIHSPVSALIVLIFMLIYMQVEAYVLTPKVMSKAVSVPGSVVLISALAGGTLFGLAGALVAIPISAGAILIIREVVMPRRERA